MSIDLCTTTDVRLFLTLPLSIPDGPGVIDTYVADAITAGTRTVSPALMDSITVGSLISVDIGTDAESVIVDATTDTTFTALFTKDHATSSELTDTVSSMDVLLGRLIPAASAYLLWRTGNMDQNGDFPESSPFVEPVEYDQWYDGPGGSRLFLLNYPIRSVEALTINGASIPQSAEWGQAGFSIDGSGKSLVFSGADGGAVRWDRGFAGYPNSFRGGCAGFSRGVRNVRVQYTAGYTQTPWDLKNACVELVAYNYKRRNWTGMKQVAQPQSEGTVQYAYDWITPPAVEEVIRQYSRRSF